MRGPSLAGTANASDGGAGGGKIGEVDDRRVDAAGLDRRSAALTFVVGTIRGSYAAHRPLLLEIAAGVDAGRHGRRVADRQTANLGRRARELPAHEVHALGRRHDRQLILDEVDARAGQHGAGLLDRRPSAPRRR